jgi:hypothetical protein
VANAPACCARPGWMHLWLSECARVLKEGAPVLLVTDAL